MSTGYPDNNPKTAFGMAKCPMDLCPPALTRGAAEAFANGATKYGPYNWREKMISSSVYYAACKRHLDDWWDRIDSNDLAPDSLVHHLKHAAACIGMILDTMDSPLLNDNRPPRVNRHGNDPRGKGEATRQDGPEDATRVLAHAGAERDGQPEPGLSCVFTDPNHTRHGGYQVGSLRGDRDKSPGQTTNSPPGANRESDLVRFGESFHNRR